MGVYNKSGPIKTAFNKEGLPIKTFSLDGLSNTPIRVMTYNVGGWYDGKGTNVPSAKDQSYYNLQYSTIQENDPDILFINESWDQFSQKPRTAMSFLSERFPYIYHCKGTETVLGRCVCSKFPLSRYEEHYYGDAPDARYYDSMLAEINGRLVTLVITFFWYDSTDIRASEAQTLLTFLQSLDTPFICCGDLNTGRAVDNTQVIKVFLDAGYEVANRANYGSFITYADTKGSGGYAAIDNVILSPEFTIRDIRNDPRKLTDEITSETADHMPLIVDISFV